MFLPIIALAPAVALVWLVYAMHQSRPENRLLVAALFVLGGGSAFLALVLNHTVEKYSALWSGAPLLSHRMLFWVAGIGLNEEFSKMLVLLAVLYPRKGFVTAYQGMLGAATVALGFAAVENVFYLERYGTPTLLVRSVLTVPAHACFSIPMGLCVFLSRREPGVVGKYLWLVTGLAAALALHGVYNIWLSMEDPWMNRVAYAQVILMLLLAWRLLRHPFAPALEPAGER